MRKMLGKQVKKYNRYYSESSFEKKAKYPVGLV